jgi:hypothetical protein
MKLTAEQVEDIKKRLSKEEDVQEALDEMVHQVFSEQACRINNQGQDAQIEFLAEQFEDYRMLMDYIFC